MENLLLGCDWGTSSLRLRLIDRDSQTVLQESFSSEGIATIYTQWVEAVSISPVGRQAFYSGKLKFHLDNISRASGKNLSEVPLIISGMASSSIGMKELPYASLPFGTDGSNVITERLDPVSGFPHEIILLSGVAGENDAMRGEETQLIGIAYSENKSGGEEVVYIFPGTHSKHLQVKNNQLTNFKSYITGELFDLLAQHSLLKSAIAKIDKDAEPDEFQLEAFNQGVSESGENDLLHSFFSVRINQLFSILTKEQNFFYLSGLLIGSELNSLKKSYNGRIKLCSGRHLYKFYRQALTSLDLIKRTSVVDPEIVDNAAVEGQLIVFKKLVSKL